MQTIYLFTNIPSHYRQALWTKLLEDTNNEYHFVFGGGAVTGIKEIDFEREDFLPYKSRLHRVKNFPYKSRLHRVKNFWYKGHVLYWQKGVISRCFRTKMDSAIFVGDMYCLATWIAAIICRIRNIKVVFWGHGFYGNEGKIKLFLRKMFYRLAHKHLLYERRAKQLMIENGFNPDSLYVVFNSLDYNEHVRLRQQYQTIDKRHTFPFFNNPELPVLVFIGRLTPVKNLDLLMHAVNAINAQSAKVNLLVIGDGPEKQRLQEFGKRGVNDGFYHFTGACYDERQIGLYLSASDLCVSPGNVGLTAVHSLSFGTPVATHSNFANQMPEVGAITEGYNGFLFEENNSTDLKDKIQSWLSIDVPRDKIKNQCFEVIDNYYNPNYQLTVFNRLAANEKPEIL